MLGHLIYNYQHLDDVRIQQEISKELYAKKFKGVYLVHAYNGLKSFGYQKYLEDKLIILKNRGHYKGAADLINAGLDFFTKNKIKGLKYVLVTAGDTWMLNLSFLSIIITEMEKENRVLAVSSWGRAEFPEKPSGFSADFFVIDIEWNRKAKLFPVNLDAFIRKFQDFLALQYKTPSFEAAVQYRYHKYFQDHFIDNDIWRNRNNSLRRIVEREPVHIPNGTFGARIDNWPKIGLYTAPHPEKKQKILKKLKYDLGKYSHRLITAKNLAYYNKL